MAADELAAAEVAAAIGDDEDGAAAADDDVAAAAAELESALPTTFCAATMFNLKLPLELCWLRLALSESLLTALPGPTAQIHGADELVGSSEPPDHFVQA